MVYYFILDTLNEVGFHSAISLKQRSTCRHVTYMERPDRGTKDEWVPLLFSDHIYEGVMDFGKR